LHCDKLRIPPIRIAERPQNEVDEVAKQRVDLPIIYEDEALLVIDKPEGIAVHGGSGVSFGVIEALRRHVPWPSFLSWRIALTGKPQNTAGRQETSGTGRPA
jgi:23S rRNA pseudouridine955/2504/2580 synthase